LDEPFGVLPEERLFPPEERVVLERGMLEGALNELLFPPERLLEFHSVFPLLSSLRVERGFVEDDDCIHRFCRLLLSGVTAAGCTPLLSVSTLGRTSTPSSS
tara:strand:- start:12 stop:317 length:306 start_codon:yes stop_codon:yes gene_type:complete